MNEGLTNRVLEEVMGWDDDKISREATWLRSISHFKYDSYRDYLGGMRFSERLADWLQQFKKEHRQTAYDYIRNNLIFVSFPEIQHLVECFFPSVIESILIADVSKQLRVPNYLIWTHPDAERLFNAELRKTLFIGLSDGARIDILRRANERRISNEQVLVTTQVNDKKWADVLSELRKALKDENARFRRAFLVDDFVGSGRTLIRRKESGEWTGKLKKFRTDHPTIFETHFERDWTLYVHHYVASSQATGWIEENGSKAREQLGAEWFGRAQFSYGVVLPESARLVRERHPQFWFLTEEYYDEIIDENEAIKVGGETARRGFGGCGLPLVLEHNTPNNSVALLWAETKGEMGPSMRPLFRRAQRHW